MIKNKKTIKNLYKPDYKKEKRDLKTLNEYLKMENGKCQSIEDFTKPKANLLEWRAHRKMHLTLTEQAHMFEIEQIIKRYKNTIPHEMTVYSKDYLETLSDILSLKNQKEYLKQRFELLNKPLINHIPKDETSPCKKSFYVTNERNITLPDTSHKYSSLKHNKTNGSIKSQHYNLHSFKLKRSCENDLDNCNENKILDPDQDDCGFGISPHVRSENLHKEYCFFQKSTPKCKLKKIHNKSNMPYFHEDHYVTIKNKSIGHSHFFNVLQLKKDKETNVMTSLGNYTNIKITVDNPLSQ